MRRKKERRGRNCKLSVDSESVGHHIEIKDLAAEPYGTVDTGASKSTPGDAKCVTEILGGQKIRKLGKGGKI